MSIRVHSFDWTTYAERVMPAFARWLVDGDEETIYNLYMQTRKARAEPHEESFAPTLLQAARAWPRARAFVRGLPRGPHAQREYQLLCTAESFTELSDRYVYRRHPRLYQNSDALRAVWDALVEEYCLLWLPPAPEVERCEPETTQSEVVSLLQSAHLDALAQALEEQTYAADEGAEEENEEERAALAEDVVESGPPGIEIGRHPLPLALRGWLASLSVRAMVLFELLACGRRHMPFAYQPDLDLFIGYLKPEEVRQLVECLRGAQPPAQAIAEQDFAHFRKQVHPPDRSIDEVLPPHAAAFLQIARQAAQQGAGLLCRA